jgi:1-deoxy-D-xylulose-5-phosphate reductoisomerase
MVEYTDGSVLAQLANPDMRIPIAHALAWPDRMESGATPVDLFDIARLDFSPPDLHRFPCLRLAYEAAAAGGSAPAILNAANEEAVAAFLERRIGFTDIASVIEQVRARVPAHTDGVLDTVLADDAAARAAAIEIITSLGQPVRQGAV